MNYLGLNIGHVDPSASLFSDNKIVCHVEEERFTRKKKGLGQFPIHSIDYCLSNVPGGIKNLDKIILGFDHDKFTNEVPAYFINEWMKFPQKTEANGLYEINRLDSKHPENVKQKIVNELVDAGYNQKDIPEIIWYSHHYCHALSAHLSSPFHKSLGIAVDANGEVENLTVWDCKGTKLTKIYSKTLPTSLGWYYRSFTLFCGFDAYEGEGMLMGLAPYGKPNKRIARKLEKVLVWEKDSNGDFDFYIDPTFIYIGKVSKFSSKLTQKLLDLFGKPSKDSYDPDQYYKDIAFEVQRRLELTLLKFSERFIKQTGHQNLTLSGGVALNCKASGYIWKKTKLLKGIYTIPFASDDGIGIGACMCHLVENNDFKKKDFLLKDVYLGPSYKDEYIKNALDNFNLRPEYKSDIQYSSIAKSLNLPVRDIKKKVLNQSLRSEVKSLISKNTYKINNKKLPLEVATLLSQGKLVAWFQGSMEAGPRALGNRSILADPRSQESLDRVNRKVKFRQPWRPFCPSVMDEYKDEYFKKATQSQFMINTFDVTPKGVKSLPAIVHVDKTARPQFLKKIHNPLFYDLLSNFNKITGVPVLLNTSLNIKGEPICMTPEDAINFFFATDIDILVMGNWICSK